MADLYSLGMDQLFWLKGLAKSGGLCNNPQANGRLAQR
jgi:hypothetical protein